MNREDRLPNLGTIGALGHHGISGAGERRCSQGPVRSSANSASASMPPSWWPRRSRSFQPPRRRSRGLALGLGRHGRIRHRAGRRCFAGTRIVLHLRKDADEFLEPARLKSVVARYSDHIALPILMKQPGTKGRKIERGGGRCGCGPRNEITSQQYGRVLSLRQPQIRFAAPHHPLAG